MIDQWEAFEFPNQGIAPLEVGEREGGLHIEGLKSPYVLKLILLQCLHEREHHGNCEEAEGKAEGNAHTGPLVPVLRGEGVPLCKEQHHILLPVPDGEHPLTIRSVGYVTVRKAIVIQGLYFPLAFWVQGLLFKHLTLID